jgi:hypothetical protein
MPDSNLEIAPLAVEAEVASVEAIFGLSPTTVRRHRLRRVRHSQYRIHSAAVSARRFLGMGRNHPELDLAMDFLSQLDSDGVESKLLEGSLDSDILALDRKALVP